MTGALGCHLDTQTKALEDGCVDVGVDVVVAPGPDVAENTDELSMGPIDLDEPSAPPALVEFRGEVAGVTFTAGREAVAIRDLDGDHGKVNATATAAQVDTAIRMHRERIPVIARVFQIGQGYRLFSLRDARLPRRERTPQERKDYVMNKWNGLLHHLAQ